MLVEGFLIASTMRLSALLALASKATLPPNYRYGMSRPGSLADKRRNPPGSRRRPVAVEPISDEDWHLFCGDRVRTSGGRVVAGSWGRASLPDLCVSLQVEILEGKDAGKQGRVVQVIRQRNWVVLEGLNTVRGVGWGDEQQTGREMVRQVNLPFSSVGWMLRDALGQSPSHTLVSDTPSFGQHFRYVGRTRDQRGTMIPSEAPLLHNQVKLVDPVDRQAHGGLWVEGCPPSDTCRH